MSWPLTLFSLSFSWSLSLGEGGLNTPRAINFCYTEYINFHGKFSKFWYYLHEGIKTAIHSYLLMMCYFVNVITLEPQSIDDPGVYPGNQRRRNSNESMPHYSISLGHPLFEPRYLAGTFLIRIHNNEYRASHNQCKDPRTTNNQLGNENV